MDTDSFNKFKYSILVFFLSLLFGCQNFSCPITSQINADVVEVFDGDTIQIAGGRIVRYIGIDTPELHKRTGEKWVDANEPFAKQAKEFNEKLVKGKRVKLEFDVERRDKYGRVLAYCFVDNEFVNERILEEGLGLLYTSAPNVKYADILVASQKKARDNQKGLWAKECIAQAQDASFCLGKVATITGKVLQVARLENVVYLNFGRDYRSDFTAVIFNKDLPSFIAAGYSLSGFKGKVVRVFGKIKEYNGPEIIIHHPSQIEVIQ
ncbi:MAG: thermonuclease family protein [Candidatus Omnitrophota bacterium]